MSSVPKVHLLARAIIKDGGQVLFAQARGHTHTFLPGGHVEPGEGLRTCLARELAEETGIHFEIGAFLGVIEYEWQDGSGSRHHELNHVFAASSPGLDHLGAVPSRESHLTFEWVPRGELEARQLMPPLWAWLAEEEEAVARFSSTFERG